MEVSVTCGGTVRPNILVASQVTPVTIKIKYPKDQKFKAIAINWPGYFSETERFILQHKLQELFDSLGVITEDEYQDRISLLEQKIFSLQDTVRAERTRANEAENHAKDLTATIDEYGLSAFMKLADRIDRLNRVCERLDRAYTELRRGVETALSRG